MRNNSFDWKQVVNNGLIGGGISVLLCLIGMVLSFDDLYIVYGVVTMGQILLYTSIFLLSYLTANHIPETNRRERLVAGILDGFIGGSTRRGSRGRISGSDSGGISTASSAIGSSCLDL